MEIRPESKIKRHYGGSFLAVRYQDIFGPVNRINNIVAVAFFYMNLSCFSSKNKILLLKSRILYALEARFLIQPMFL